MKPIEELAVALALLPAELQEAALTYLAKQAQKFRALKDLVAEGMEDPAAGNVSEWNVQDFLRDARRPKPL